MPDSADARPDFAAGVPLASLADGVPFAGRMGDDDAVMVRRGDAVFAIGGQCSHYHAALAEGLVVGDTLRCPLHHAVFDLRTGEALRAPALDPVPCWRVALRDGRAVALEPVGAGCSALAPPVEGHPGSIVIVGGGAAGLAAAQMLRRAGFEGRLTMLSADDSPPCDRPNLSKDFLAGTAPEDWLPLRPPEFYAEQRIELRLATRVTELATAERRLTLADGSALHYGALLLATGAEPLRFPVPGADEARVRTLRSLADSRAIVARAGGAKRVLVVGASFIGLEVAASLRARGVAVHVVDREPVPMARVLGQEAGHWVRALHEAQGVVFHLGTSIERVEDARVRLADGTVVDECELIVLGAGVRPSTELAERAGLALDRGVLVDEFLRTSAEGVWAAGDIARWPDVRGGAPLRVEHWAVAQAQGQVAALNMMGARRRFDTVPFFWSQHYDVTIQYTGHAERWDRIDIEGSLEARDATLRYVLGERVLAVATVGREGANLRCELALERGEEP